jgi:hypothetical protein
VHTIRAHSHSLQQSRTVKTLSFADNREVVYERTDFPLPAVRKMFANDTFTVIGYGTQARPFVIHINYFRVARSRRICAITA